MQASLTLPPEANLISGDNPVYIGNVNRGESRIVNWTLVFTAAGVFNVDVNASGYRQDTSAYVERQGSTTVTVHGHYTNIDVDTAYDMITSGFYPNFVVLDVRTQGEYDSGHIYGAVWIPVSELEVRIGELAGHENHEIIVYCRSGVRSITASEILYSYNFTKVYNMLGGIQAWQSAGYPVWIATVHNVNTTFNYDTIQAAIDAPQTLDGHTILVDAGTYYEHVVVRKTLSLIGENRNTTIIDGKGIGTVVTIDSEESLLCNFTIQNGDWGVWFDYTQGSVLKRNDIINNTRGNIRVSADPWDLTDFFNDVDSSNTVDGKPVCWWTNQFNKTVPSNVGCVILVYSTNITVQDLSLSNNDVGTLLVCTNDSRVQNVSTNGNWMAGISLIRSNNNTVFRNRIFSNSFHGISLDSMSKYNMIIENEISDNSFGISLQNDSSNNSIHHNSIVNNTDQTIVHLSCVNSWDDGYPSGGNHWSDYTRVDDFSGPFQNETGSDGIGDKPYDIDEYNRDRYPLMKPYGGPHDIGIVNVTTSKTLVVQGGNLSINVKIVNYGANNETFNVTAYANEIIIQTKTITLANRNSTTTLFTWNTTGFTKGKYSISAEAHPVPSEIDTTDNTLTDGLVKIILQSHDIGVVNVTPSKTVVGKGYNVSINVIAENWGNHTETFNVTAYYNPGNVTDIPIETQTVTLTNGGSATVTFTWNTTVVAKGNYTLSAYANPVPSETDTTDNNLTEGWIIVAIVGDITGGPGGWPDGKVNIRDVSKVARLFGVEYPDSRYDANCDIIYDYKINIRDISAVTRHFGETDL